MLRFILYEGTCTTPLKARKDKGKIIKKWRAEIMERVTRIELALLAWKARALPLSYTRISNA
jgi:hypothetical protein